MSAMISEKFEFLRFALEDTAQTIRSQDTKASYMFAIESLVITGYVSVLNKFHQFQNDITLNDLVFFFPLSYFFISMLFLIKSYYPRYNPEEKLNNSDRKLIKDKFFISTLNRDCIETNKLAERLLVHNEKDLYRILYGELIKLSSIRDVKINGIKKAIILFYFASIVSLLNIVTLFQVKDYLFSLSVPVFIFLLICRRLE